jgi:AraC-like DNA-binding protein
MELLKKDDLSVSEIAYEVGFGSHSYFTTCFIEYYGYPPGEAKYKLNENIDVSHSPNPPIVKKQRHPKTIKKIAMGGLVIVGLLMSFLLYQQLTEDSKNGEAVVTSHAKSIAVLPFKNLNTDQENEYFSESVVEAINRHLSQMGDLRVISLTSTDPYRESDKSAQKIGEELNVSNLL